MSKNVYFDVSNDIVHKYKNTYHRTIKVKPINVKTDCYAEHENEKTSMKKLLNRFVEPQLEQSLHLHMLFCLWLN